MRLHVRRLHRCLLRIRPLASEKRLHQMKPVQLASETYDNTPHSPCSSTSKLLEDHKCLFCQALRSQRSWWSRDLFQKWQTLSHYFLDLSTNMELIFPGSTLKTLLFKKFRGEIQFFTSELVRRSSKLPFEPRHDWSLRSRIREGYVRQC